MRPSLDAITCGYMSKSITVYLSDEAIAALNRVKVERRRSTSYVLDELVRAALSVAPPPAEPFGNEQVPT